MKQAVVSVALLVGFAGCSNSAADRLARERREAIDQVCEQEATDLAAKQTAAEWKNLTDELQKGDTSHDYTPAEVRESFHRQAKQECLARKLAADH